jgi:hypothetical protein
MCLIFLVTAAIIAAIVMKIAGVGEDKVKLPGPKDVRLPFTLRSRFLKSDPNKLIHSSLLKVFQATAIMLVL